MKNRPVSIVTAILILLAIVAPVAIAEGLASASSPPAAPRQPSIAARDQRIDNGTVTIARVVSNGPGWVVVHRAEDGGPIGRAQVGGGVSQGVVVRIDASRATRVLSAMLHKDEGGPGAPVRVKGEPVSTTFRVERKGDNNPPPGGCQKDCETPKPPKATATKKPCEKPCATRTPTPPPVSTQRPRVTRTPLPTPTPTQPVVVTPPPTATPTQPVIVVTATPTSTPLPTSTPTQPVIVVTATPSSTPLPTATPTQPVIVVTATPSSTPLPTATGTRPVIMVTATPTQIVGATATPSQTPTQQVVVVTNTPTPGAPAPTVVAGPTPGVLPVTGHEGTPWPLILLIVGGMALINGMGFFLLRHVGSR